VQRVRRRIARDGWGARLLVRQDPEGTWAGGRSSDGGLYSPKWTSTTYTMLLLRDCGLPATNRQAHRACRALDYFQSVNAPRDPRLAEAIEIVRTGRREDGRWALQHSHKGKTYFELERVGAASRWNTLRALRVLRWWNRGNET
jgi:hypothetical protein